ncbi:Uu.00g096630.m01.CDS01 [Anthostomella pinea]|uniref:Uu.00g096630.m01.CDS01 n=1 Tax=Anthostomella pinea TaxID=933095 RepID=A0AAI8VC54_9PEZI|nr:Uu.00g096630.m01.CDS01 [Anthostomella pinea]
MRFLNLFGFGLAWLAIESAQFPTEGRNVNSKTTANIQSRSGWDDLPTFELSELSKSGYPEDGVTSFNVKIDPKTAEAKKLSSNEIWVRISYAVNTELEVHKALQAEDITPQILAIVNLEGVRVGFVSEYLKLARQAERKEDKDACREVLETMHKKGWVHGDPNTGNFLILGKKVYVIDFETAEKATSDLIIVDFKRFDTAFW